MSGNVVTDTLPFAAKGLDRRAVTAALMLVMVLASMEQTITSTAMVTIIGDLHGFQHYAWVASIYLLCCTVTMPLYGRLADVLGRKPIILFSIVLFIVASVLAASARSMLQLICFRGMQGLGAGGIMPLVLTILGDIFTLQERAKIQGLFSAVWGTSSLVGPALGAFLVKTLSWRSIFYVNLPFGLLGMVVLIWKYHDREKPHSTDLDLPGVLLLGIGCMAMLCGVSLFGSDSWSWQTGAILTTVTIVAFICFILRERTAANPIFSIPLILNPNIGPSLMATMLLGVCIFGLDTYVPLYVQGGLGHGVGAAAGVVTPVMLMWALSGVIAAPLIVRWGFRKTAMCGGCLVVIGFAGQLCCAWFHYPPWILTAVLSITGFGFGPASMSYILAAQDSVEWQQRGIVTGAVQFFRTIGGALGIGLLGALFNVLIRPQLSELHRLGISSQALLDPLLRDRLDQKSVASIGTVIANGLFWVFVSMLAFAVLTLIFSSMMSRRRVQRKVTVTQAMEAATG